MVQSFSLLQRSCVVQILLLQSRLPTNIILHIVATLMSWEQIIFFTAFIFRQPSFGLLLLYHTLLKFCFGLLSETFSATFSITFSIEMSSSALPILSISMTLLATLGIR